MNRDVRLLLQKLNPRLQSKLDRLIHLDPLLKRDQLLLLNQVRLVSSEERESTEESAFLSLKK